MHLLQFDTLPVFPLAELPTPLQRLDRLSAHLGGPRLLVKRDDLTGLAFGGNKTRKLEFLVGDAIARGADTLVTAGAAQSNHCRQTAAAAAKAGIRCTLVLGGKPPGDANGNLLLDMLLGAEIHWAGDHRKGETLDAVAGDLLRKGHSPYLIPYGGSNQLGAAAYAKAMLELLRQLEEQGESPDAIIVASSSGGTQAGLIVGAAATAYAGKIIGVSIDKEGRGESAYADEILTLARVTAAMLKAPFAIRADEVRLDDRFLGDGYGKIGALERDAIRLVARKQGILLDPVYTARAMGGLISMIEGKEFSASETVLFWHTGGTPALFADPSALR